MRASMLSIILLFIILPLKNKAQSVSVEQSRIVFEQVRDNEKIGSTYLRSIKNDCEFDPIICGYKGAIMMVMAKHFYNPYNKWKYFVEGKKQLEISIKDQPKNIELIYLRFCIQTNAPRFLGYHSNITNDRQFLKKELINVKDKNLRIKIITYLTLVENKNIFPQLMLSTNP